MHSNECSTDRSDTIFSDLIFDCGMHNGNDSEFYLNKGFRVVAVEAMLWMARKVSEKFREELRTSRLTIINRCLADSDGRSVSFFINNKDSGQSSVYREKASNSDDITEVQVQTISIQSLFRKFGVPRYLKIDLEGADEIVLDQVIASKIKPPYISCEINSLNVIAKLMAAGYNEFQIINQNRNYSYQPPNPSREGEYCDCKFTAHHSGLFGRDLDNDKWLTPRRAIEIYLEIENMFDIGIYPGWFDIHARVKTKA